LQHRHYSGVYAGADFLLIENGSGPIGRIYVHRTLGEICLMEVSLLSAWRGQGIGSALLRELLDEARASATAVTLHVEPFNPARKLYERFGFRLVERRGVYDFYRWQPLG
jgi:ribosomal protein S18 acetylase RimI-like enzyme